MISKNYQNICNLISKTSPYIRFVGIIGKNGELLAQYRRAELKPLLDSKNMRYQFASIALNTNLEEHLMRVYVPLNLCGKKEKSTDSCLCY